MFGLRSRLASPEGHRYIKITDPTSVWTVHRTIERPQLPVHVELRSDQTPTRSVIVGRGILDDRRLYRPLAD